MIRISNGPPGFSDYVHYSDGRDQGSWARGYGLVTDEMWEKLQAYMTEPEDWSPMEETFEQFKDRIEAHLSLSGPKPKSMCWEFNADSPDHGDWVRYVAYWGEQNLVEWSWVDAHVRYPLYQALAWFNNKWASIRYRSSR